MDDDDLFQEKSEDECSAWGYDGIYPLNKT